MTWDTELIKKTYSIQSLDHIYDEVINNDFQTPNCQSKICGNCGFDFNEYIKTGFLGCSECYHYFKKELERYLDELR